MSTDGTTDPTATDTGDVFTQEQAGDPGQVPTADEGRAPSETEPREDQARGSGEADDDQAPVDADDPELSGANLDEDQADGRGPSIEPGA